MEKVSMSHEDYLEAIVMVGGTTEQSVRSVLILEVITNNIRKICRQFGGSRGDRRGELGRGSGQN